MYHAQISDAIELVPHLRKLSLSLIFFFVPLFFQSYFQTVVFGVGVSVVLILVVVSVIVVIGVLVVVVVVVVVVAIVVVIEAWSDCPGDE